MHIPLRKPVRFSIVIPTYNSATTIINTLESISDQQWPSVEVLVIDAASQDRTVELVKAFVGLKTVVISEPDNGIYDAINKGIARANGDLICVVGSDDRLVAGAFSAVCDAWYANQSDIVAGEALLVSSDGTSIKRTDEVYGLGVLVSGIPFCHNSMYVTPEAYCRVGDYSLNYRICADAEWVHRSVRAGCTCSRIEKPLIYFSLSGTSSGNEDLIMAETYAVIAANFPGLSTNDAEILFKAVRRWTDDSEVAAVLNKYRSIEGLFEAVAAGLHPTSTAPIATAQGVSSYVNDSLAAKILRKIRGIFRSYLTSN